MLHLLTLALSTLAPIPVPARPLPACPELPRHLEGRLDFRGDAWTLRLHLPEAGGPDGAVEVDLDIPDLMMAGRATRVVCGNGAVELELPFGFGAVPLAPDSTGGYRGAATLAGDSLRVYLEAGSAPPYRIERVRFDSDGVLLSGALYLPEGEAPSPAIVVVHGSGPQGLDMLEYRSWGDFYARRGVAALVYDKRGVGGSGGDFREDSAFVGLTSDALAAVRFLRDRPEIDRSRVGVGGWSQAGWIAYRAARDPAVAFLALVAAPSVGVAEQEVQRVREGMRAGGFEPEEVDRAVAHTRLLLAVAQTGLGWDALAASTARISGEAWAERVHRPDRPGDLGWWRDHAAVDPGADLRALRVPLFAAFSMGDPAVPAVHNAGVLRELAEANPGSAITVLTVPRGDHRLEVGAGRDARGRWHLPRVHPTFIDGLTRWIEREVGVRARRP